jgi:hypothetical protein
LDRAELELPVRQGEQFVGWVVALVGEVQGLSHLLAHLQKPYELPSVGVSCARLGGKWALQGAVLRRGQLAPLGFLALPTLPTRQSSHGLRLRCRLVHG